MAADIYTKQFTEKDRWHRACKLINVMLRECLKDAMAEHSKNFAAMKTDEMYHPNNVKPMSSNSRTHKNYLKKWEGQGRWGEPPANKPTVAVPLDKDSYSYFRMNSRL